MYIYIYLLTVYDSFERCVLPETLEFRANVVDMLGMDKNVRRIQIANHELSLLVQVQYEFP